MSSTGPRDSGRTRGRRHRPSGSASNISAGNLGSWPVLIGLALIVIFFSFKADNFFTPGNFTNIITQMAGVTMLAYGVVFVLLIGEIDLSISYVSGVAGVVVAQLTLAGSSHELPGLARDRGRDRCLRADRRVPGLDRGADRGACVRRHAGRATRSGRA